MLLAYVGRAVEQCSAKKVMRESVQMSIDRADAEPSGMLLTL